MHEENYKGCIIFVLVGSLWDFCLDSRVLSWILCGGDRILKEVERIGYYIFLTEGLGLLIISIEGLVGWRVCPPNLFPDTLFFYYCKFARADK